MISSLYERIRARMLGVSLEEYLLGQNVTDDEFWERYGNG